MKRCELCASVRRDLPCIKPTSQTNVIKPQITHGRIVQIVEPGKGIKCPLAVDLSARGAQIGTDQPVAIHRVE